MEPDLEATGVQNAERKGSASNSHTCVPCPNDKPKALGQGVATVSSDPIEAVKNDAEVGEVMAGGDAKIQADGLLAKSKRKKKKNNRPASKRGIGKPTGMEEFYADPPLTPDQYTEQKELYDPDLRFVDRIITAIQRFERTRRLVSERRDVFYKWLQYGGFESGQNMFMGNVDPENMDKDELATALSQVRITDEAKASLDENEPERKTYVVDFLGCTKGFLSYRAYNVWSFDTKEQIQLVTSTLERFMDYLLQHDVCPEYESDVLETRELCRDATAELWACSQSQRSLPGDFNMACSTLFGGEYGQNYDGKTYWGTADKEESVFVGLTPETAMQIVGFAIAGAADEEVYQKYLQFTQEDKKQHLEVVKKIEGHGFEIMGIEDPTADCQKLYVTQSENFRPVGRILGKPWLNPEAAPEDLSEEERRHLALIQQQTSQDEFVFFIEDVVLRHLSIGQKIQATISQLSCGIWFFDEFVRILPNFETFLLNEMMVGYKEPKLIKSEVEIEVDHGIHATGEVVNEQQAAAEKDGEASE